jgi:hypothetical protein
MSYDAKIKELAGRLSIDKDDLDTELITHAELYWHASEMLSELTELRDKTKQDLKLREAEIDAEERENAAITSSKITDKQVGAITAADEIVVQMQSDLIKQNQMVKRVEGLVDSYRERRHNLNKLVDLYTSNYWSAPRGVNSQEAKIRRSEEARREIVELRKKRPKLR